MAEDTDTEPALDPQEIVIQNLRDHINQRVDDARKEGEQSGFIQATFHVAQLLLELADPLGYKVVLVRKDVEREQKTSAPKPPAKKAKRRKATRDKLPLTTKLRDLPGIKPRILDMLSLKDKRTIGDIIELNTEYLRSLHRVGPQAVRSLDDALAKAGYSRPVR